MSLATLTELARSDANWSIIGPTARQGPHQGAQKSTSVGKRDFRTSALKFLPENLQEDEFLNGHSHCRQMLTGTASVTIPVVDGEVLLGTWQRVLFVEFDQARERRVVFHTQGV